MKALFFAVIFSTFSVFASNDSSKCSEGYLPEVKLDCTDELSGIKFSIFLPESDFFCIGESLPDRIGRLNGIEVITDVKGPAYDYATGFYSVSYKNGKGIDVEQNSCSLAP